MGNNQQPLPIREPYSNETFFTDGMIRITYGDSMWIGKDTSGFREWYSMLLLIPFVLLGVPLKRESHLNNLIIQAPFGTSD